MLDGRERMSLAACRALARQGFEVGVAGHERERDLAARSRYARRFDPLPDPSGPAEPYESALRALVERQGYVAIVPSHDVTLARLASIDCPVPTLSPLGPAWHELQDKVRLASLCERADLAYPATVELADADAIASALERVGTPAYVKSARSAVATADRVGFTRGARRVRNAEEARLAFADLREKELPVIVQEAVPPARKYSVVVLRRDGSSELRYALGYLREYPRTGGIGATLETLDPRAPDVAEAIETLERVCEAAGYEGIVQAELYRRRSDGRFVVLDVNPRLWGSVWFAERLGLKPVERALRNALDLPALPSLPGYPASRRFHTVDFEVVWALSGPKPRRDLARLFASFRPADSFEWLDLTDPAPTFAHVVQTVADRRSKADHHQ